MLKRTLLLSSGLVIVLFFLFPAISFGQFRIEDYQSGGVGIGIWYGVGSITFDAASSSASDEVQGYTDVLPSSAQGAGGAIGISFGDFGLNFGFDVGELEIDKLADIQQNSDVSDDVLVIKARRINRSITVLFQPVRFFYLGFGTDIGTMEFVQKAPGEDRETNRIGYESPFYSLGVAIGFDPTESLVAPITTIYVKVPTSQTNFSGTVSGIGVGLFF